MPDRVINEKGITGDRYRGGEGGPADNKYGINFKVMILIWNIIVPGVVGWGQGGGKEKKTSVGTGSGLV